MTVLTTESCKLSCFFLLPRQNQSNLLISAGLFFRPTDTRFSQFDGNALLWYNCSNLVAWNLFSISRSLFERIFAKLSIRNRVLVMLRGFRLRARSLYRVGYIVDEYFNTIVSHDARLLRLSFVRKPFWRLSVHARITWDCINDPERSFNNWPTSEIVGVTLDIINFKNIENYKNDPYSTSKQELIKPASGNVNSCDTLLRTIWILPLAPVNRYHVRIVLK